MQLVINTHLYKILHIRFDKITYNLKLKDGGYGDNDGLANGVIVDPGGIAFTQAFMEVLAAYLEEVDVLSRPRLLDQNMRIMFSCFADSGIFIFCPIE